MANKNEPISATEIIVNQQLRQAEKIAKRLMKRYLGMPEHRREAYVKSLGPKAKHLVRALAQAQA